MSNGEEEIGCVEACPIHTTHLGLVHFFLHNQIQIRSRVHLNINATPLSASVFSATAVFSFLYRDSTESSISHKMYFKLD